MPLSFNNIERIFSIKNDQEFNDLALEIFHYQYHHNNIYHKFLDYLGKEISSVHQYKDIPCLPIEFFKNHKIISGEQTPVVEFQSSGTTGMQPSIHYVVDIELYKSSFLTGFHQFYGDAADYIILGLLPSYLERKGSSLVFMVDELIRLSKHEYSGFYLDDHKKLDARLKLAEKSGRKIILLGVSYALLDFCDSYPQSISGLIVMETGGMKGKRKEMTREELHHQLKTGFNVKNIHSEYGMTELLSQAYSKGDGIFTTPPWMKVLIRDSEDPLNLLETGKSGGINIIDLANLNSCAFLSTQDLGKQNTDGTFEVSGRFDSSDIRGCNLMVL